jgi:hypothetical protein
MNDVYELLNIIKYKYIIIKIINTNLDEYHITYYKI